MPRSRRIIFPGYPHHVTHRGNGGRPIFLDKEDHLRYLMLLDEYTTKFRCAVLGYCLMTNHVHLMLKPEGNTNLGSCMHGLAFLYAQWFNRTHSLTGHLWESCYYSCPVDTDEHLWRVMRYVYRNPVSAGIVTIPWEYRWSSAKSTCFGELNPYINLDNWLDPVNIAAYREYLIWSDDPGAIRTATRRGTPLGVFTNLEGAVPKTPLLGQPQKGQFRDCPQNVAV